MIKCLIEWIPYSQFKDLRKIGEGGFSIIYKATWSDGIKNTDVALKKLFNSQKIVPSSNNEIYGVIPYIAPEIFEGAAFSQKSDIYSFVYEIIDGKRPEITMIPLNVFANLMKKCWDSDPSKRATINDIRVYSIKYITLVHRKVFGDGGLELIQLKKTWTPINLILKQFIQVAALSSLISKSSIDFSSINSVKYITKEYELDINKIQSSSTQNNKFLRSSL
ncbi:unnamed protein product [Rhizophagus irregularis]|nr:unnamed protein product [Rhizophagus irregularis]